MDINAGARSTGITLFGHEIVRRSFFRRSRLDVTLTIGLVVTVLFASIAVFAPVIAAQDPAEQNLEQRLIPPVPMVGSDPLHPLGTDHLGRDVWSRLCYGARISLLVAILAVLGSGVLGVLLGLVAGYFGGFIESTIMGLVDAQLALPFVLVAIALVVILGPSFLNIVAVLVLTGWVAYARVVRSIVLSLKEREFVEASRAVGAGTARILFRHILPNTFGVIVVIATLQVAEMMISEAALSFLGLGIQPPTPSWGNMIADGRTYLARAWWLSTLPGLAITISVIAINFLGDSLRERMDPYSKKRLGITG